MFLNSQQLEAMMPDASQLYSDEPEMESSLHYAQLLLLVTCLEWLWQEANDYCDRTVSIPNYSRSRSQEAGGRSQNILNLLAF